MVFMFLGYQNLFKLKFCLIFMDVKQLTADYFSKVYDPQNREVKRIVQEGRTRGKRVLIIGTYGVLNLAFKIQRSADVVVAVHTSKELIEFCQSKKSKVNFIVGDVGNLPFDDKSFDVAISCLSGLHINIDRSRIVRELIRVLDDKGILLIEEANEKSEFAELLDQFAPVDHVKLRNKKEELKKLLEKGFKVEITGFKTFYKFDNVKDFKKAVEREIVCRGNKFNSLMDQELDRFAEGKKYVSVGESMMIFVCRKVD
jgi:ubiquinone/menaquinone biosynthesis C-methylase UbiE